MVMEDRRRSDDKNWDEIRSFMAEQRNANEQSRLYRAQDDISQKYQAENIASLVEQVKKQNGRTFELEKWREEVQNRIKNRREEIDAAIQEKKDKKLNTQSLITIIATVIMAVSAAVMIFKK